MAAAMMLAGATAGGQVSQSAQQHINSNSEIKATPVNRRKTKMNIVNEVGGVPLESYMPNYGMSPKEYGIRYGNGNSRRPKHNRLRYSHNAKLKRRLS